MTFSSPVNILLIHLIDYTTPETFTITTNTANPSIVPCDGCCYNITNNLITVGPPGTGCRNLSPSKFGGSGQFTIAAATSYTTVTISGPGGGGGTLLKICDLNFTTPTPTPTLTPTPTPTIGTVPEVPGDPAACTDGMDVVFLLDYTGSMGNGINSIKSSIISIVNTIQTESNNNYRLGLVTFDEYPGPGVYGYGSNFEYTSLPISQRKINTGSSGIYQWITAWEKMGTNNIATFTTQLNKLNGIVPLGSGSGQPEPSDMGVDLISTNNYLGYEYIAGTFRPGVSKLIILITDAPPSGDDDVYNSTDVTFINGLIPQLFAQNIRVLLMTSYTTSTALNTLSTGTNGSVTIGFNPTSIITAIQNICP
jgi:hypothetical protein